MIKINVTKQSNYPVGTPVLKKKLKEFFERRGIVSAAEVSVAFVGEAKMLSIGWKYLKDRKLHNVLSFTQTPESGAGFTQFIYPPDDVIHLGEIIVCYPVAFAEAKEENKLIEDKVWELVEHGALHLLGIHHEGQ